MMFVVQSLMNKPRAGLVFSDQNPSQRTRWVEEMRVKLPGIRVMESVNGFDQRETEAEMRSLGLRYQELSFKNYGVLACWITKYKGFLWQASNKIDEICWLEDDVDVGHDWDSGISFVDFVTQEADRHPRDRLIRMGQWGECYVTRLEAAERVSAKMLSEGISANVDNQLRECGEIFVPGCPYRLRCPSNFGDTLRCAPIDEERLRDAAPTQS